jgi:hypothetical protein
LLSPYVRYGWSSTDLKARKPDVRFTSDEPTLLQSHHELVAHDAGSGLGSFDHLVAYGGMVKPPTRRSFKLR